MQLLSKLLGMFRMWRPFVLTVLCGLILTAAATIWINHWNHRDAEEILGRITNIAASQIEARISTQNEVLRGLQGAFIANAKLDSRTFHEILDSQNILVRLPGFVAIGFSRHLPDKESADSFVSSVHAERGSGHPAYLKYRIHPEPRTSTVQPIDYLYPINATTIPLLGLDLLSIQENRGPVSTSRDENRGVATAPIQMDNSKSAPLGFMVHYPVYSTGSKPSSLMERQHRYQGTLSAIYQVDQALTAVESSLLTRFSTTRLYDTGGTLDRSNRLPEKLLHETRRLQTQVADICASRIINLPGRQWRFEACSTQEQTGQHGQENLWLCWFTFGSITLLLATVFQTQEKSRELASQLANEMTTDLRKHEDRHQKLVILANEARDLIVIRNAHGVIEYANPAAQRRFHQESKPLEQSSEPLLISAELSELNEPLIVPCSHRSALGDIRHYEAMLIPMRTPYGQHFGSALLARDVTRRIEQNEEQQKTNERLSDLLELSSDWLWEQGVDARFTHVSSGFFKLHDLNPAHDFTRVQSALNDDYLSEQEWKAHCKLIETHQPYRNFIFTMYRGQQPLVVSLSGKPVFDDLGLFAGYRGVGQDITALHQAKMLAQSEKQRVLATLESLSDGVITTDPSGRIDYMNPVAIALTGRESQEAIGQPVEMIFQIVDANTRLPLPSLIRQVLTSNNAPMRHRTAVLLNRFGLTFMIQEAIACIRDDKGNVMGSVVVFRDLSDWISLLAKLPTTSTEESGQSANPSNNLVDK